MATAEPSTFGGEETKKPPTVTSLRDLTIIEAWDWETNKPKYTTFYLVTDDEELWFGESPKNKREITIEEYNSLLYRVRDDEIYPEIPKDVNITIAPDVLRDGDLVFVKRPGLVSYEEMRGTDYISNALLSETLTMEEISKTPHPGIVGYYGCRVRRGRITAILLERLGQTLTQYESTPNREPLDKEKFLEAFESTVDYLHSLGLAHNDINPDNIMIKDGMPVLIDFGGCQPFGKRVTSNGTEGWREELFFTSEKKHDIYALGKLREWFQKLE
ncbi:hypothetical protein TWF225_009325 [Orbilia oligospora]|nr:hypothetical protein TWF225_009325 [Orbilia oligospora]KAF3269963.1 hypothetical protein TWF217_008309 [Orbilia oligospora]KAF3270426.1 hypothetical protein TWF128_004201 [Orbilia oligospora]KAF3298086.1 hypothetical protein TWF132_004224 [Orbilia oligospora]